MNEGPAGTDNGPADCRRARRIRERPAVVSDLDRYRPLTGNETDNPTLGSPKVRRT